MLKHSGSQLQFLAWQTFSFVSVLAAILCQNFLITVRLPQQLLPSGGFQMLLLPSVPSTECQVDAFTYA